MSDRPDWGLIGSGATFQALVQMLVRFEDDKATPFDRPGKDAGQDARSGDGTRVFQAKYHQDGSAAKAIQDAKHEASKIARYRSPDDPRSEYWTGVTHWRLVTNAAFGPADKHKWDAEVLPLFAAQGLTADYWERSDLEALLAKQPEVTEPVNENETVGFRI